MHHVEILVGSKSDLPKLKESTLTTTLAKAGVSYSVSVCSAHRNLPDLLRYISYTHKRTDAYICVAGWSAALPGTVKAFLLRLKHVDVFGVALSSEAYPDALDAVLGITRLPPGVPVSYCGIDVEGLDQAGEKVLEALANLPTTQETAKLFIADVSALKPPQFNINLEEV